MWLYMFIRTCLNTQRKINDTSLHWRCPWRNSVFYAATQCLGLQDNDKVLTLKIIYKEIIRNPVGITEDIIVYQSGLMLSNLGNIKIRSRVRHHSVRDAHSSWLVVLPVCNRLSNVFSGDTGRQLQCCNTREFIIYAPTWCGKGTTKVPHFWPFVKGIHWLVTCWFPSQRPAVRKSLLSVIEMYINK